AWQSKLVAGLPAYPRLEDGTVQGINDYYELGWGGPCPPDGSGLHHYVFTLLALDAHVQPESPTWDAWRAAVDGHVLDSATLAAYYAHDASAASFGALRQGAALRATRA
ncbi:MAG TPA: YbhB/YbcL family Raf kinase inhibitor-like protein, partial [Spirochaetales bacterium]|nr:YbhB/YbcL family Raf kinase inhibitor-like protein [Spirochaetales bacterium]